jgi:hypothetical protein
MTRTGHRSLVQRGFDRHLGEVKAADAIERPDRFATDLLDHSGGDPLAAAGHQRVLYRRLISTGQSVRYRRFLPTPRSAVRDRVRIRGSVLPVARSVVRDAVENARTQRSSVGLDEHNNTAIDALLEPRLRHDLIPETTSDRDEGVVEADHPLRPGRNSSTLGCLRSTNHARRRGKRGRQPVPDVAPPKVGTRWAVRSHTGPHGRRGISPWVDRVCLSLPTVANRRRTAPGRENHNRESRVSEEPPHADRLPVMSAATPMGTSAERPRGVSENNAE